MQKIIAAAAVTSLPLLSACATIKGLGRDIESAGEAGQDVID